MTFFSYSEAPYPIRDDLTSAHRAYWDQLSRPGAWWSGAERVAIAGEVRRARDCALCAKRKDALSPGMVDGEHEAGDVLMPAAVDATHRIVTDASRLSKGWLEKLEADGLSDGHYVELVGIVSSVVSIDSFHHSLGLPLEPLPEPEPGAPTGYRPAGAVQGDAWVPWLPPSRASGAEATLYPGGAQTPNVFMAMSLVPDAVRSMALLSTAQYMSVKSVALPGVSEPGRAIDRAQTELIAARVSAANECFY